MDRVLQGIERNDLGGGQEMQLLKGVARVAAFTQLQGVDDLIKWLGPLGRVALLYPVTSETNGHWLAVWADPKTKTVHHFDSYGLGPEQEAKYTKTLAGKQGYLVRLYTQAQQQGWKLVINRQQYQSWNSGVNTCGRHVICRLRFHYLNDAQYQKLMIHQKETPDTLVTLLTFLALNEDESDVAQVTKVLGV